MKQLLLPILIILPLIGVPMTATAAASSSSDANQYIGQTGYHTQTVGDVEVFYREAGPKDAPVILLLHGFPSSSHQFRNLIPLLADNYRVIAPDYPGFGSTVAPARGEYTYSFDQLGETMLGFTDALGLEQYSMYVFDYGAPVGFRLATANPERITAIISQNGNVYEEGLTEAWNPLRAYWKSDTQEDRDALRGVLTHETTQWQYYTGAPDARKHLVSPDAIAHDQAILDRDAEIQLDLFSSYKTNVSEYPAWQAYLKEHQPPVLAIWAKNDPFFGPAGAEAFKRDVPDVQVEFVDAGHFALETHVKEIAHSIRTFLGAL